MPPKFWFDGIDDEHRIRTEMVTDSRGRVVKFMLQLEILIDDRWVPIVRYDTAHEEAHIDYIDPRGQTVEKVWLNLQVPYNAAFALAENEIKRTFY